MVTGAALLATAIQATQELDTDAVVQQVLRPEGIVSLVRAAIIALVGFPVLLAFSAWTRRTVAGKYSPQQGFVAGKLVLYVGLVVLVISLLGELGFSLAPLLGAAGIVGIAVGFASQTSISNVISGLFLIGEHPFHVDDVIQVGDTTGTVLSIDTLSIKLRTFDNRFVRIPNETIIKTQVTTITRFPIRRLDLNVGVAYKEDVQRVREALLDVAHRNPKALVEPEPRVFFDRYGDSALELRLVVWFLRENFLALKNSILEEVKARFDEEGIEIPFPHRTLYAGLASDPFPVRVVPAAGSSTDTGEGEPESGPATRLDDEADGRARE